MTDPRKAAEQSYGAVCAHGQLARSCNICELERERDAWKAKAEANERAAHFAQVILKDFFPDFGNWDGLDIADAAIVAGLMHIVVAPPDDDRCSTCDGECDQCWRFTEHGQRIVDAARSAERVNENKET